ncbi:MAG: copper resistance protein CopC [Patescibacteria group bacterium]|nr:copper resistance protein CopC [Patescibacteria group bacterium]
MRFFISAVIAILSFFFSSSFVLAEAKVVSSDPASEVTLDQSPGKVSVTFSEAIVVPGSTLEVKDNDGNRINAGQLSLSSEGKTLTTSVSPARDGNVTVHAHSVAASNNQTLDMDLQFMIKKTAPLPKAGSQNGLIGILGLITVGLGVVLKVRLLRLGNKKLS